MANRSATVPALSIVDSSPVPEDAVRCIECDRIAAGRVERWRAFVIGYENEPVRVLVYCPVCADREFGIGA